MRTEEEQAEILREWWEKNGLRTVVLIILAVAAMLGWRQWQGHQSNVAADASSLYQMMVDAAEQGELMAPQTEEAAWSLIDAYPRTAYADHARLLLAREAVLAGEFDEAVKLLEEVLKRPANRPIEHTARLRLVRVMLEQGELGAAMSHLDRSYPEPWQGQALELRGDVLLRQERHADARDAYARALELLGPGTNSRHRVEMKLNDLTPAS